MFKKLIALTILCMPPVLGMEIFKADKSSVFASESLGKVKLFHDNEGFHVIQNNEMYDIKSYFVDPLFKKASIDTLEKFQKIGYFEVKKLDNEEFAVKAKVRGLGGGALGASVGFWLGKGLVYGTAYSVITVVSLAAGPGAPVLAASLMATFAAPIEAASNVAAIGVAITTGVATGPV